jgi:hypothetical protein
MKWAFISTSSPMVTVAILEDGVVLASRTESAPMRASGAVMRLLDELGASVDLYVADVGPGSFTGVKVGVTIAKTLAFAEGVKVAGLSAFDLINPSGSAAVPSRKGKHLVRDSSGTDELPSDHRRVELAVKGFPSAENAALLHGRLQPMDPVELMPNYVLEPSISTPKKI